MPNREIRLTPDAEQDLRKIARYTLARWGAAQQREYETLLASSFEQMARGTSRAKRPIPRRGEILQLKCERHYVFAIDLADEPLIIVAVLHERMDLIARLRTRLDGDAR